MGVGRTLGNSREEGRRGDLERVSRHHSGSSMGRCTTNNTRRRERCNGSVGGGRGSGKGKHRKVWIVTASTVRAGGGM